MVMCSYCRAEVEPGKLCDCGGRRYVLYSERTVRLLAWAKTNAKKYPVLAKIREESAGGFPLLKLDAQYGLHVGLVVAYSDDIAQALRQREDYAGYAVAYAETYEAARACLLECASWVKTSERLKKRRGGKP